MGKAFVEVYLLFLPAAEHFPFVYYHICSGSDFERATAEKLEAALSERDRKGKG